MCNGNCQQGRTCDCDNGMVIVLGAAVLYGTAAGAVLTLIVQKLWGMV